MHIQLMPQKNDTTAYALESPEITTLRLKRERISRESIGERELQELSTKMAARTGRATLSPSEEKNLDFLMMKAAAYSAKK